MTEVKGGIHKVNRIRTNHPDILFGDELTGALNSSSTKEVMDTREEHLMNWLAEKGF